MQSSEQVNNIAPNYSPEVETEKPFTRKRKENDLDGKVMCVFWWDRHCRVAHRQNRKFAHAHIAILARVFAYLPSFYFQIIDLIYWTVLIFFGLFWMAWHWKPAIRRRRLCKLRQKNFTAQLQGWQLLIGLSQLAAHWLILKTYIFVDNYLVRVLSFEKIFFWKIYI